jgi:hypothetical protein
MVMRKTLGIIALAVCVNNVCAMESATLQGREIEHGHALEAVRLGNGDLFIGRNVDIRCGSMEIHGDRVYMSGIINAENLNIGANDIFRRGDANVFYTDANGVDINPGDGDLFVGRDVDIQFDSARIRCERFCSSGRIEAAGNLNIDALTAVQTGE